MSRLAAWPLFAAACLGVGTGAQAVTLKALVAGGGTLQAGALLFSDFAIEPVPITSPQGARVNDGADVDVGAIVVDGRAGLHLLQVDALTGGPSPLAVDLAGPGEKNFLRNLRYTVTVTQPGLRLHAAVETLGPATGAEKEVSGFVGTFIGAAHGGLPGTLNNAAQIVDPALAPSFVVNPAALPGGDTIALDADTAWTLTTGHGRGVAPVGRGQIDAIDITWSLAAVVPEPATAALWALGLGLFGGRRALRRAAGGAGGVS